MEDAGDSRRLSGLDAERDDVLDLEVDRVADLHGVPEPLLANVEASPFDSQVLADERPERFHRAAELSAEDAEELLCLLLGRTLVDEDAEPPVSVGHDLWAVHDRSNGEPADVG